MVDKNGREIKAGMKVKIGKDFGTLRVIETSPLRFALGKAELPRTVDGQEIYDLGSVMTPVNVVSSDYEVVDEV